MECCIVVYQLELLTPCEDPAQNMRPVQGLYCCNKLLCLDCKVQSIEVNKLYALRYFATYDWDLKLKKDLFCCLQLLPCCSYTK